MTVRGIEAIKLYIPPTETAISDNIVEETPLEATVEGGAAMTSVDRYRQEWQLLLLQLDTDPERLRETAFRGALKFSKFRSIYWALLLRVLNGDHSSWCIQRAQQRARYEKFKVDYICNPHELNVEVDDNPLSQSAKSIWNQYFSDQGLIAIIRQDVVRTFPGTDFFRKPLIQNAMTNILFYYAREHPYMCYRQGMHEILAPIIFVLYGDHQSLLHYKEIEKTDINPSSSDTLLDVLNPEYLEADAYSIFSRLMSSVESYYRVSNSMDTSANNCYDSSPSSSQSITPPRINAIEKEQQNEVEIIGHLNFIRDKILVKEDLHLHNRLLELGIPLHLFGIRWLRVLFGREFPLLDLLTLWDAIFADSDHFDLPNYILVSMLIHIRDKLLTGDPTSCLTILMRYPSSADVGLVLRCALHMLNPKKFERPVNAFSFVSFEEGANATMNNTNNTWNVANARMNSRRPMVRYNAAPETSAQSTSNSNIDRQIKFLQERNAANDAALAKLRTSTQTNRVVMEGYLENSPELMRLELKNAQTVINIARGKLQFYLANVRKHIAKQNTNVELERTLDGIDEVCSFLDIKFMFPLHGNTVPIDQAHEANEQQQMQKLETSLFTSTASSSSSTIVDEDNILVSCQEDHQEESAAGGTGKITYEKPENALLYNPSRMLGNKREIELITIASNEKPWQPVQNGLPAAEPQIRHPETE